MICSHSLDHTRDPLRMHLGRAGGTGKSQVIREFFKRQNRDRRFRLTAYTGVAVRNIGGMTLHAALSLSERKKSASQSKMRCDLIAMWEGVDYPFIDEVSMIGCRFLLDISDSLSEAKGKNVLLGGVRVILAGDFAQPPLVGEMSLYARWKTSERHVASKGTVGSRASTTSGQHAVFGKSLWLGYHDVVILKSNSPTHIGLIAIVIHFKLLFSNFTFQTFLLMYL